MSNMIGVLKAWLGRLALVFVIVVCIFLGLETSYIETPTDSRVLTISEMVKANTTTGIGFVQAASATSWDIMGFGCYDDVKAAGWLFYAAAEISDKSDLCVSGFYRVRPINGVNGKFLVLVEIPNAFPQFYLLTKQIPVHYWNGFNKSDEQDQFGEDLGIYGNLFLNIWPLTNKQYAELIDIFPDVHNLKSLPSSFGARG